nr:DUF1178 family protein [uncultured Roseibium sp.]
MIKYSLVCDAKHGFEGWFRNSGDFDAQLVRQLVTCPACGSAKVEKRLMAPAVSTSRSKEAHGIAPAVQPHDREEPSAAPLPKSVDTSLQPSALLPGDLRQKEIVETFRQARARIIESSENVGTGFADEARKIHYGDAEERSIYGETTPKDAVELLEEGIPVMPLPELPEDKN